MSPAPTLLGGAAQLGRDRAAGPPLRGALDAARDAPDLRPSALDAAWSAPDRPAIRLRVSRSSTIGRRRPSPKLSACYELAGRGSMGLLMSLERGGSVDEIKLDTAVSRRRALALGGAVAGGLLTASGPLAGSAGAMTRRSPRGQGGELPVKEIEEIVGAEGHVSSGVLEIDIAREDIGDVAGPLGVTFTPAFEIHGELYFQPLGHGAALLNGDLALLPDETNRFIAALLEHGLVFQAFHQHFIELRPMVWFVHFRGIGDPLRLARAIRRTIDVTRTPLPQSSPAHPTTPLDADRLARILHGDATVGDEGVVTVSVNRTDRVRLGGVHIEPETGISTSVEFKPLGGSRAAVVPDFSMRSDEVDPVVRVMLLEQHWFQGCLYNQETDEHPQLYFDHMLKTGDAYALAGEVRRGLNRTRSE
jgi:hypothetical protein